MLALEGRRRRRSYGHVPNAPVAVSAVATSAAAASELKKQSSADGSAAAVAVAVESDVDVKEEAEEGGGGGGGDDFIKSHDMKTRGNSYDNEAKTPAKKKTKRRQEEEKTNKTKTTMHIVGNGQKKCDSKTRQISEENRPNRVPAVKEEEEQEKQKKKKKKKNPSVDELIIPVSPGLADVDMSASSIEAGRDTTDRASGILTPDAVVGGQQVDAPKSPRPSRVRNGNHSSSDFELPPRAFIFYD